jgi:bacteriocin biosynthesis cyclodehydratase domain-containing protein
VRLRGAGDLYDAVVREAGRRDDGAGRVVSVYDRADARRDTRLRRALLRRAVDWLPVRGDLDRVWVGPESGPNAGCSTCLLLRRRTLRRCPTGAATRLDDPRLARLVLDIVEAWPAPSDDPGAEVVSVALPGLERTVSRLLAVPDCPACAALGPRTMARAVSQAMLEAAATDGQVGLLRSLHVLSDGSAQGVAVALGQVPVQPHPGLRRPDVQATLGIADTAAGARAIAVFEALERYCCVPRGRTFEYASADELGDRCLDPGRLVLHTPEQYGRRGFRYRPFDPAERRYWTWADSAARGRQIAVPADLVFYRLRRLAPPASPPVRPLAANSSNGCAIRREAGEAALYALLEVLERDALLRAWYRQRPLVRLRVDGVASQLVAQLDEMGYDALLLDTTSDELRIPAVWAMAVRRSDDGAKTLSGAGCHPDPEVAVTGALREILGRLDLMDTAYTMQRPRALRLLADPTLVREVHDHALLYALPEAFHHLHVLLGGNASPHGLHEHFRRRTGELPASGEPARSAVFSRVLAAGADVLVADMTSPDVRELGCAVVRAFVPGTVPLTFGFGKERLAGLELPSSHLPHPFA